MSRRDRTERKTRDLLAVFTDALEGQDFEVCANASIELAARIIATVTKDRASAETLRAELDRVVGQEIDKMHGRPN